MNELNFLQQYIDAAKDSTNRTRHILLVMFVASILIFTAFWNSRGSSWGASRLRRARAMEDINDQREKLKPHLDPKAREWIEKLRVPVGQEEQYRKAIENLISSQQKELEPGELFARLQIPDDQQDLYESAFEDLNQYHTLQQAQDTLFWAQQIRAEQLGHIQVPVLGISIDVNDLGMLGGITLTVLLMWEYYSLWHHANNLKLAFGFAETMGAKELDEQERKRLLYHTYQNLATHQVLTIPPRPASIRLTEPDWVKRIIRKASKVLYFVPPFVQLAVVVHDFATIKIGDQLNPPATTTVLIVESLSLLLIVLLTLMCLLMWRKIYKEWQTAADNI